MNKKFAQLALWLFAGVSAAIVAIHAYKFGFGLDEGMTISKYVGLAQWSAVIFLLANMVMAWAWVRYAWGVRKEWGMSKLWFGMATMAALMLVMLSLCPMGLYDETLGQLGMVSRLHQLSSSSMFVLMLLTTLGLIWKIKNKWFRMYSAVYMVYGVIMALLFVTGSWWFWMHALWLESIFLLGYLVMLTLIPRNREKS